MNKGKLGVAVRRLLGSWTAIRRSCRRIQADDVASTAAGVVLFVVPGLVALISLVKLFGDPARTEALLAVVADLAPGSAEILARQIGRLTRMTELDEERRRAPALTPFLDFAVLV